MKIKVCGMRDAANIAAVAALRPDYMGFVFYGRSPRHAGTVDPAALEAIPDGIVKVGVFVDAPMEYIAEMCSKYKLDAVQLHGEESPAFCGELRKETIVIKAFGIGCTKDLVKTGFYEDNCDYFLFDTKTPLKGGSGLKFDHNLLGIYDGNTPFFLSGGIGPQDTGLSGIHAQCHAVDVNSGFEISPGLKDTEQLKNFINEIRKIK